MEQNKERLTANCAKEKKKFAGNKNKNSRRLESFPSNYFL
jgi:hypothetical protein